MTALQASYIVEGMLGLEIILLVLHLLYPALYALKNIYPIHTDHV